MMATPSPPAVGIGMRSEVAMVPSVAIRPTYCVPTWLPLSTNQIFPSGPAVIP